MLVTDVGGLAEFVDDRKTGIVAPNASPDSIKEGICEFFDLLESIDFEANIRQKVGSNTFNEIVITFNNILADINR